MPPDAPEPPGDPILELQIERLSTGGEGVAHEPSGRVVFVPWTAPGDRVRVRLTERRARFARGTVEALLEPGPERTDPVCEAFGSCGGCTWQHVRYPTQVAAKADFLRDAFRRIAHLEVPEPVEVLPCPVPYGYRTRTRVRVEGDRIGYRRRRSHEMRPVRQCPILAPALERALGEIPGRARGRSGDWWLALSSDGRVHAAPAGRPSGAHRTPPRVSLSVGGHPLECGLGGFHQSNGPLFETVAAAVAQAAGRGGTAVELFAGAGYLTLGLAGRFERILAVEGDARAVRDLERNLSRAGIEGVEIVAAPVERALDEPPVTQAAAGVFVVDPPRTGLPPGTARALAALEPGRVVYLSCDPATLARDAAVFADAGYAVRSLRGFDLFPQTPHVEALAVLERHP